MTDTMNQMMVRTILAAVCVTAALGLAGCDLGAESDHAAQRAGNEAAWQAVSAGDMRPSDKLLDEVAKATNVNDVMKALEARVAKGDSKDLVLQPGTEKDLLRAISSLQKGIDLNPSPVVKSGLQAQLGATQLLLAEQRAAGVQAKIDQLNQQADSLRSAAQTAVDLLAQAAVWTKASTAPTSAEADAAKVKATHSQEAVTAAEARVTSLTSQIADKEAQAKKIYADTEAAFDAARALTGNASITAGKKAMEDRAAAEKLTAEAAELGPELAKTQAQLAEAKVKLNEGQQLAKLSQAAFEQGTAAAKAAQTRSETYRDQATKLINDKGVKDMLAAMTHTIGELEPLIKDAVSAADQASRSYLAAANEYRNFHDWLVTANKDKGRETGDPLVKLASDDRMNCLLFWSQSAALQQAARVELAAAAAFSTASAVAKVAAEAKAGDAKIPDPATYRKEAETRLGGNVGAVKIASYSSGAPGGDVDKIRWIGKSLEATAQYDLYLATGNANAMNDALAARNEAASRNPEIGGNAGQRLSWIRKP